MVRQRSSLKRSRVAVRLFYLLLSVILMLSGCKKREEAAFKLKEVSAFDLIEKSPLFGAGLRAESREVPDANVTAYPILESAEPIYGLVHFGGEPGRSDSGVRFCFALDESGGTGGGYDRLYLDLDQDLDLTNDPVLRRQKHPPEKAVLNYASIKQQACFECVDIPLAFGPESVRPLKFMPRLMISESGYRQLAFVTTKARSGRIRVAGQKFDVLLGHNAVVFGWFDHPWTALHLTPHGDRNRAPSWWGGDRLMATHNIGGSFYCFSATPAGDKLTVRPYEGSLGTFEIGTGGRDIEAMTVRGSLLSEKTAVPVGRMSDRSGLVALQSCRLPVGDYLPNYLTVTYGRLRIGLSNNYHSDGRRMDLRNHPKVYGITIRQDQPYVFDFSSEPAVMFASPAKDLRIEIGEELNVMAVLTDPVLDFMIRRLDEIKTMNAPPHEETVSLDPKVVITRADGEVVAEGVMPFG